MELKTLLDSPQFSLVKADKESAITGLMRELQQYHVANCVEFERVNRVVFHNKNNFQQPSDFPFLPVSAFKNHSLKSIPDEQVYKVLTSSGTTGQEVSKITLDKETASLQTLALSKIISHIVGKERLPMLIIDSKAVLKNREMFSARGAGILGLSVFGKDHVYVLDENFDLDTKALMSFLETHSGKNILIFGFTFMVWQYLYEALKDKKIDLSKAILIHSGGWKKLADRSVDNATFRKALSDNFGLTNIYNFYGMVEQVGSVFLENSEGFLHAPNFADVIIRDPKDFSVLPRGKEGLIQVISVLPKSYPGFSLLTEDIGVIEGEDNATNGWKGKYFRIIGRAKKAELRGCSDTFTKR